MKAREVDSKQQLLRPLTFYYIIKRVSAPFSNLIISETGCSAILY